MADTLLRAGLPCALRGAQGDGRTLHGHFAVFNQPTTIRSYFEGEFVERIAPGAFVRSMVEDRANLRVLLNHGHDFDAPGMKPIAEIQTLREDAHGAYYEAGLLDGVPELVVSGLRAGQYGARFRFEVLHDEMAHTPGPPEYTPGALPERTIHQVKLYEFGPVTFGAYPIATAGLRSLTDWYRGQQEARRGAA